MFFCNENGNDNLRWRREMFARRPGDQVADSMTTRRRGSLPIDVLLATHSGASHRHYMIFYCQDSVDLLLW